MKVNHHYKHLNNREVAILVEDVDFDGEIYDLMVTYYNLNYGFYIDSEEISIRKEDIKNWKEIQVS